MNFEKQVKFADQLAFKIDNPPLFQGEEPPSIEFKNNLKPGLPIHKSKGKKGKKNKKQSNFIPPYLKQRPKSAKPKVKKSVPPA